MCLCLGKHVVGGGAADETRLSGPSDGAGDRGDPSALPGQETAHHGRHQGQKTTAAELLRRTRWGLYSSNWMFYLFPQQFCEMTLRQRCGFLFLVIGHEMMQVGCDVLIWKPLRRPLTIITLDVETAEFVELWLYVRRTSKELFSVWQKIIDIYCVHLIWDSLFPLFRLFEIIFWELFFVFLVLAV